MEQSGPAKRVLVVDDEAIVRRFLQCFLRQEGMDCEVAEDGLAALARVEQAAPFDVVITDYRMPGMNGLALARYLRNMQAYRHTPILLHSCDSPVDCESELEAAGITAWLHKGVHGAESILNALVEVA